MFGSEWEAAVCAGWLQFGKVRTYAVCASWLQFGRVRTYAVCASWLQFGKVRTYAVGALVCYIILPQWINRFVSYLEEHVVTRVTLTKAVRL